MAAKAFLFIFLLVVIVSRWCSQGRSADDQTYSEKLFIRQLSDGKVMSLFRFKTTWNIRPEVIRDKVTVRHYGMFPKSLGQIVSRYEAQEVHVSLTQGQWSTSLWGYSPRPAPLGAELWAWFMPGTDVNEQWKGLANALSGLLCASLNFISPASTFVPVSAFRPRGSALGNVTDDRVRYAALPRETVCTENFTPWKKLLPCDDKAGIAQLFSVKKVYNSHYHSLGLDFFPECRDEDCTEVFISLELSLLSVTEPTSMESWDFASVFGKHSVKPCPLAEESAVWIHKKGLQVAPTSQYTAPSNHSTSGKEENPDWAVYSLRDYKDGLSVSALREKTWSSTHHNSPPVLWAHRYITGSGQEWGGVEVQLHNALPQPLRVVYLDMMPWFLRLYTHTLTVTVTGPGGSHQQSSNPILHQHYVPSKDRVRPHQWELLLLLPPQSSTSLRVEFERAFLRWNEHPPDAHHGFYVNSAVVTTVLDSCINCTIPAHQMPPYCRDDKDSHLLEIYTEPLLVQLSTPDFSMMFNVICFVSTVVAIAFGSLHNLTAKVLVPIDSKNKGQKSLWQRLFSSSSKVKSE